MSRDRKMGRRALRPSLEGRRLEPRLLLAHAPFVVNQFLLTHPQPGYAKAFGRPPQYSQHAVRPHGPVYNKGVVATQTAHGGQSVIVAAPDGSRFRIQVEVADNSVDGGLNAETGSAGVGVVPSPQVQANGTVRAYAMPGGKVGLIVDGTTQQSQITINPLPVTQRKNYAHSFAYGEAGRTHILNIGSINVTSGQIGGVLGFHSADLSGPLTIGGNGIVDRIAFDALLPGAAVGVGGTVNTLDIAKGINLTSGPGVSIGRDLNLLNVAGDIVLANGANFTVGRDLGLTLQPPKGSGTGSNVLSLNVPTLTNGLTVASAQTPVSAYIEGNLIIGPGSSFIIGRAIDNEFDLLGSLNGASRFFIGGGPAATSPFAPLVIIHGSVTA